MCGEHTSTHLPNNTVILWVGLKVPQTQGCETNVFAEVDVGRINDT
jgi:hypothetical protein